jgi:hypothetical protein
MIFALRAVLGVDLIVIVAQLGVTLTRRRWVSHQPGGPQGSDLRHRRRGAGLGPKWKRGHGRWARDVLVWAKTPALFRNELVASTVLPEQCARPSGVKGYREIPILLRVMNRHFHPQMLAGKEEVA